MVTREELYRLVWGEPMSKLAERFEVSGSYANWLNVSLCLIQLSVPPVDRVGW